MVRNFVWNERWLTIPEMVEEVRISYGSCQVILTEDVGSRHVLAKFIPQLLAQEEQEWLAWMHSDRWTLL